MTALDSPDAGADKPNEDDIRQHYLSKHEHFFRQYSHLNQYATISRKPIRGLYVIPRRDDLSVWRCVLFVYDSESPYFGGIFAFQLDLGHTMSVRFDPIPFHPSVDTESGQFHLGEASSSGTPAASWALGRVVDAFSAGAIDAYASDAPMQAANSDALQLLHGNIAIFRKRVDENILTCKEILLERPASAIRSDELELRFDASEHGEALAILRTAAHLDDNEARRRHHSSTQAEVP